ncbi:MAG: cytotoxic translational repressor of toxin-antitoxin stability system [Puniceicoccales bacterium]|jgi:mRNA-degrading endonuclease RelE of RelBE toxin-antitoxin system|nr:cytotoxic translational repressor of toxin-antitoxin stability system [Puniceicoccales bacterium]
MYQVNFSNQSMAEINKLATLDQMTLVEAISAITPERIKNDPSAIGIINREGKVFYRLRFEDFRVYFEVHDEILFCNCILHKHSLADFVFRMKLPFTEEQQIEQDQSFWKYLDSLKK